MTMSKNIKTGQVARQNPTAPPAKVSTKKDSKDPKKNPPRDRPGQSRSDDNDMDVEVATSKRSRSDSGDDSAEVISKKKIIDEEIQASLVRDKFNTEEVLTYDGIPQYVRVHANQIKKSLKGDVGAEDSLDALVTLIFQLSGTAQKLTGKLEERKRGNTAPSFAQVAATPAAQKLVAPKMQKQASIKPPQKILLVKSKTDEDSEVTKQKLMKCFNPQREGVQIKNIRKTRNGLLIETNSEEDLKKLEGNKNVSESFKTERPKKRNPRIIIYDVPKDLTEEQLADAVLCQNKNICRDNFNENFTPRFKTGKRNNDSVNWVVEVTPCVRNSLLKLNKIYIGWIACRVQDFLLVTKCYKCQGYGHISKYCDKETVCSCCAEAHKFSECPNKDKPRKCINCIKQKRDSNHDSMDKKCPSYKLALERTINSTDYGL